MTSALTDEFTTEGGLPDIPNGTSILLTGDDTDAIRAVFNCIVAPPDGERSIVLSTDSSGTSAQRELDNVISGAKSRTSVLACEGPSVGDNITSVDDLSDLTRLGMDLSTLLASAQQESDRFRSGIFLCSTIASEIDDTRSLYRFLNSNFLTELRRGDGIGVCAIDMSADIGADMTSTISGLQTSFKVTMEVIESSRDSTTVKIEGPGIETGTIEVAL